MKFLHTADWQIGMKADFVGSAAQRVRDERLAAGTRVVEVANRSEAQFILATGDLFENNAVDRTLVRRVIDILSGFQGQVFLIPGNHDPLAPGSVWDHPSWKAHPNLVVLKEPEPVEIPDGLLFPCPIRDKYARKDPTAWIGGDGHDLIRLGMAHGNVEGLPQPEPELPIPRNAALRADLDYLALGHWHSTSTYPDPLGIVRMAYCGTPETSRFGERDSGNALMIEIPGPKAAPQVQVVSTGRLQWRILNREALAPGDLKRIRMEVENLGDPQLTLLDLRLKGLLDSQETEELARLAHLTESHFLYARLDASALIPSPEDHRWIESLPSGILREAAGRLRDLSIGNNPEAQTASQALILLYTLSGEMTP